MKIFVTNLPSSTDRRRSMLAQFDGKALDYEFFPCVVGKDLTEAEIAEACDIERINELNKNGEWFTRGIIGCSMTSRNIHREIVDRGLRCAVLLEDDTLIPDDFKTVLEDCEKIIEPGDVVLLFWVSWAPVTFDSETKIDLGSVTLYDASHHRYLTGGSATIFTREAAANMLRFNTPIQRTPDCWGDFAEAGCFNRVLCAYPPVVDTADMMSTMEHGRFVPIRRAVNKYRIFPFYQLLKAKRRASKRRRTKVTIK